MSNIKLNAKERKIFGRKVKQLRRAGKVPGNVFGPKTKSKALTLEKSELLNAFKKAGETTLIDLVVEAEKSPRPILITNMHLDPVTNEILHVDLHQVDLTSKTTANIPVITKGESPAVEKGGILVLLLNEIEVEALPADLPENFTIDISKLEEIGDTILVKDLSIDKSKLEIQVEDEEPVVMIQEPREEEPEPVEEGDDEGEATKEEGKDKPEAEVPAEDAPATEEGEKEE